MSPYPSLFVAERVDRVGSGDLEGVTGDRANGDGEGKYGRDDERFWAEVDTRGKAVQPVAHGQPSDRPSYEIGQENGPGELPDQQAQYVSCACTDHLAYPYLLGPPFGDERGK